MTVRFIFNSIKDIRTFRLFLLDLVETLLICRKKKIKLSRTLPSSVSQET